MKKKATFVAAVSALLLVLAAGIAFAVTKDCDGSDCHGTSRDDNLFETSQDDFIQGLDGRDFIDASEWIDDTDDLHGNAGNDVLNTADGDLLDSAVGGKGNDVCLVDPGEEANADCERVETRSRTVVG